MKKTALETQTNLHVRFHVCPPSWQQALGNELARTFPASGHQLAAPGWFRSELTHDEAEECPTLAFSLQCLPNAELVDGASIREIAGQIGARLQFALAEHSGPWRLHAFRGRDSLSVRPGRAKLLHVALIEYLGKKQRRLLRSLMTDDEPWLDGEALVQSAFMESDRTVVSICPSSLLERLQRCISRFPGGVAEVDADPRPPSRAYQKLLEAERHFGTKIEAGQTCVDLGGSPGGWSWVALERGALVTAVDRSPLRPDLMKRPELSFHRGDAFRYEPDAPVDWLLCDVIAFPQRTVALIAKWLENGWCRRFCATVKFRGDADYPVLEDLKRLLEQSARRFYVRRLLTNKNEVTACGWGAE